MSIIRFLSWKRIVSLIMLIFGMPVALSCLYSYKLLDINIFTPSDLLNYYGNVLGGCLTLGISVLTILFTKKQIIRQAYVDREKDKWIKVESKIAEVITKINPLNLLLLTVTDDVSDIVKTMGYINKYALDCRIATDVLTAYVNAEEDYTKIKNLVDRIRSSSDLFYTAANDLGNEYQKIGMFKTRAMAIDLLQKETAHPGILKSEELDSYYNILKQTEGLTHEAILHDIGSAKSKLTKLYENEYRSLLELKGTTFKIIMDEIDNKSFEILDE